MKRFVVVGLLPEQARAVEQAIGKEARLLFVCGVGSRPRLPNADAAFLAIKWCRHTYSRAAYKQYPRRAVHLVQGGVSDVIRAVGAELGRS